MSEPTTGSTATSNDAVADEPRADDQPSAEDDAPVTVAGLDRGRGPGAVLRGPVLPWVIAVLALALAGWFALQASELRARETARAEALRAGELAALQLTTFTGAGIDQWVEKTKSLATETFAQDLSKQYDQQLRADLTELDVESVGEVLSSFVQRMDGDEAMVFAVLRQTTRYPTFDQTVEDEVRFEISLQREDGTWQVNDAQLLSPTPPLQARPFLDEQPSEGG